MNSQKGDLEYHMLNHSLKYLYQVCSILLFLHTKLMGPLLVDILFVLFSFHFLHSEVMKSTLICDEEWEIHSTVLNPSKALT
jgi:hypothetical protein